MIDYIKANYGKLSVSGLIGAAAGSQLAPMMPFLQHNIWVTIGAAVVIGGLNVWASVHEAD